MSDIEPALRELVRSRAAGVCEYCRISERFTLAEHEIDHVIAVKHGGQTVWRISPYVARSATDSKAVTSLREIPKPDSSRPCFIHALIPGMTIMSFEMAKSSD
jgi:hypothetical protein